MPASISARATPSSSALWASMGPSVTSPMAKMPGMFVLKWSSVMMRPSLSRSTPTFSSPRPSVKGLRPTQTIILSAGNSSSLPAFSAVRIVDLPFVLMPVTLASSSNFMPCFLKIRSAIFEISWSKVMATRGRSSTIVTSLPRRLHTEPSSRPIAPAPTMTIFSGMESKAIA